ncbi:FAD-binding domain-containing protein [Lentinula aciculospora]|uniref:FAD-binding domain-containing protein n=1 Tax=Lentinula aciculospora TaxID=153920 RepID=A0A9W9AEQ3_9AGAR|nr:FAD-binding domain-containing protein [Lentinula aciculospora]
MFRLSGLALVTSALFGGASSAQNSSAAYIGSNSATTIVASNTCQELQRVLGFSIVQSRSSSTQYSIAANAAWSAFNHEVNFQPTCIVFVNSTEDVQTTMKAIYKNNADYTVQSGGHSGMTGWNTIQDGVLISFLNMNATSYDPHTDTISMQPGINWGNASTIVEPFGVAPVGGRISNVGTSLLLGGGLSYLSPSQGYAADNYVSVDIVLVDGTLVTATANNRYADLFKALKGGGNRFGIVTQYVVKAVHVGREQDKIYWGGIFVYPNSSAEALLPAIAHFAHDTNDTNAVLATDFIASWGATGVEPVIQLEMFYNGSAASFNASFAEFLSIPYTSFTAGPLSYLDLVNEVNFPYGEGNLFAGSVLTGVPSVSNENSIKLMDDYMETYRLFNNFSIAFANSSEIQSTLLSFTPVLQSQIRISYEKGGNAISPPRGQGGFNEVLFAVTYSEGVNQAPEYVEQGRQFWIENTPRTSGLPLFANEADAKQQVLASYGEYNFLKQVYAKYDPGRFNIRHTPGPLGL